jgi:phasin family protein
MQQKDLRTGTSRRGTMNDVSDSSVQGPAKTRKASPKREAGTSSRRQPRKQAPSKTIVATPTVSESKEKIMATAKMTSDFTKPINDAIGEFQARAKAAYEKGSEALTEATEFTKGNVEAVVESSKVLASGAQEFGKTYVEEARNAYETLTADLKELAAVKSPTELFQLQGKIARRNFDALVASSSKNAEAAIKLANEAFAPISGRVNAAAEKLTRAA